MFEFWWRSRTDSPDGGTDIATLAGRVLAELRAVSVLLVIHERVVCSMWIIYDGI